MAAKKIVKPNVLRGKIFDQLKVAFGESVLGMYDGKLRIEWIDDEGEVVQFSFAPVVHKTLVDEAECDNLVPIAEQMAEYDAAMAAKAAENESKKAKTEGKKASGSKKTPKKEDKPVESVAVIDAPVELTADEQAKLNELANILNTGSF